MVTVVITKLPIASFSYYQWLILGLFELEKRGDIKLKFRINPFTYFVLFVIGKKLVSGSLRRIINVYSTHPSYNLEGYVEDGHIKKYFTYDSADAPFMISDKLLEKVDVYFKMQCPIDIKEQGFRLSSRVIIPYYNSDTSKKKRMLSTAINQYAYKIKPAMVGPRRLSWGYSYKQLLKSYENMLNVPTTTVKVGRVMSYFRDAKGPSPIYKKEYPDFNEEREIMGYFESKINHPNEKRAIASSLLNKIDSRNDGRVIIDSNRISHDNLVVPYNQFTQFVSKFEYNLNISGYRMSIPNRFIESFMVGTAIVTDKLSLKWYAPFGKSVVETVSMGYEKNEDVDWDKFKMDISSLPTITPSEIKLDYEQKWSPTALASYLISTVIKAK